MELYINSEPVDFALEENLSLEKIVEKVSSWALAQNQYVLDYRFSQRAGFENEAPCRDSLEKLEFLIGSYEELILYHLQELENYIDKIGIFLANKIQKTEPFSQKDLEEWQKAIEFLNQSINTLMKHFPENQNNLMAELKNLEKTEDLFCIVESLAKIQNQVNLWYRKRKLSLLTPDERKEKLEEFYKKKEELKKTCENLATYLTTGQEQKAFQELENFVGYLGDIIAILLLEKENQEAKRLTQLLNQLTSFLDSQDFVSAADLLDFDIKESLENLA